MKTSFTLLFPSQYATEIGSLALAPRQDIMALPLGDTMGKPAGEGLVDDAEMGVEDHEAAEVMEEAKVEEELEKTKNLMMNVLAKIHLRYCFDSPNVQQVLHFFIYIPESLSIIKQKWVNLLMENFYPKGAHGPKTVEKMQFSLL